MDPSFLDGYGGGVKGVRNIDFFDPMKAILSVSVTLSLHL